MLQQTPFVADEAFLLYLYHDSRWAESTPVCLTHSCDSSAQMNTSRNDMVPVPSQGLKRQRRLLHLPLVFLLFLTKGFAQAPKMKTIQKNSKPSPHPRPLLHQFWSSSFVTSADLKICKEKNKRRLTACPEKGHLL